MRRTPPCRPGDALAAHAVRGCGRSLLYHSRRGTGRRGAGVPNWHRYSRLGGASVDDVMEELLVGPGAQVHSPLRVMAMCQAAGFPLPREAHSMVLLQTLALLPPPQMW